MKLNLKHQPCKTPPQRASVRLEGFFFSFTKFLERCPKTAPSSRDASPPRHTVRVRYQEEARARYKSVQAAPLESHPRKHTTGGWLAAAAACTAAPIRRIRWERRAVTDFLPPRVESVFCVAGEPARSLLFSAALHNCVSSVSSAACIN